MGNSDPKMVKQKQVSLLEVNTCRLQNKLCVQSVNILMFSLNSQAISCFCFLLTWTGDMFPV